MYETKDSGIVWIGQLPKHWNVTKLKFTVVLRTIHTFENNNYIGLENIESYSAKRIGASIKPTGVCLVYEKGDVLFGKLRPYLAKSYLAPNDGCCSTEFLVMTPQKLTSGYLTYLTLSKSFLDIVNNSTYGTKMPRANWGFIGNLFVPLPPIAEQKQISSYLDDKCAKLDVNIAKHKTIIQRLEEYRKVFIAEVVTKGLNTKISMKDSQIDWIGNIPKHWTTARLKFILKEKMKYGANEPGIAYSKDLPRYIRITDITLDGKLKTDNMLSLALEKAENYLLENETILFARSGATVGKTFLYEKVYGKAAFAGYLISACCDDKKCLPKFLYYFTQSTIYDKWVKLIFEQATIQNIGADKYQNLIVPLPNIKEQQQIIDYLNDKCNLIDSSIGQHTRLIAKLVSYKKSLIYNAVTGKIDCRKESENA